MGYSTNLNWWTPDFWTTNRTFWNLHYTPVHPVSDASQSRLGLTTRIPTNPLLFVTSDCILGPTGVHKGHLNKITYAYHTWIFRILFVKNSAEIHPKTPTVPFKRQKCFTYRQKIQVYINLMAVNHPPPEIRPYDQGLLTVGFP